MTYLPTGSSTADMVFTGLILTVHLGALVGLGYALGRIHDRRPKAETFSEFRAHLLRKVCKDYRLPERCIDTPMPAVKPTKPPANVDQWEVETPRFRGLVDKARPCPCGEPECKEGP